MCHHARACCKVQRLAASVVPRSLSTPCLLLAAAFGLNMSVFLLIGKTSALTMNVAGVIKDWLLIGLSVMLFHAEVLPLHLVRGVLTCAHLVSQYASEPEYHQSHIDLDLTQLPSHPAALLVSGGIICRHAHKWAVALSAQHEPCSSPLSTAIQPHLPYRSLLSTWVATCWLSWGCATTTTRSCRI